MRADGTNVREAVRAALADIEPLSDLHASADYRRRAAACLAVRAITTADGQAGNVLMLAGEWNRAFLNEHETFPAGKYKDQVDAAAGALQQGYDRVNIRYDAAVGGMSRQRMRESSSSRRSDSDRDQRRWQ